MEIKAFAGEISGIETGALIVNYFEGAERPVGNVTTVDEALGGAISKLVRQGEIKGKIGEITVIHTLGKLPADRVVIAGLGKPIELTLTRIRRMVAETCRFLRQSEVADIAFVAPGTGVRRNRAPRNVGHLPASPLPAHRGPRYAIALLRRPRGSSSVQ